MIHNEGLFKLGLLCGFVWEQGIPLNFMVNPHVHHSVGSLSHYIPIESREKNG